MKEGFDLLEKQLGGRDSFFGGFTLADAAVFYLINWEERLGLPLPAGLAAYREKLRQRPAVIRALA